MKKGHNSVVVACRLELINLIRTHAGKEDQNEGFWVIKRLLTKDSEFKAEFIEKYGKDLYQETLEHYSKTNLEQRRERQLKQKIREKREEQRLEIERMKAEAYAKQVEGKPEIEEEIPKKPRLSQKRRKEIEKILRKAKKQLKLDIEQKHPKEAIERCKKFIREYEQKLRSDHE